MANGYLPTGISTEPINIAGAGQRLMQTAVEQKLADIEQGRAMAEESQQAALEAMSMKTIQGLDRQLQDRYSEQFDQHRQKIVDMLSKSGGVLDRKQQMQIRNEQEDIINQTMADNQALQARAKVTEFLSDPNTKYGYDMDAVARELSNWDRKFEQGEYLGDPRTILMKHQLEAPVSGYIANRYDDAVKALDVESLGDFEGNVFTQTELTGLNAQAQESIEKARRLRDQIMQDPNVVRRYTANDGTVFEDRRAEIQQRVEDAISKRISESKPYRQTTGSGRTASDETFVSFTPDATTVKEGANSVESTYAANVPLARLTSFNFGEDRVVAEAIQWLPVAKDKSKYNRLRSAGSEYAEKEQEIPLKKQSKHFVLDNSELQYYNPSEYEYKPFVKLIQPKDKNVFFNSLEDLSGKKTEVSYTPFEGALKDNVLSKMGTKRDLYQERIAEAEQGVKKESKTETPSFSMAELKAAGYSDKQINDAVEAGKITIK